MRNKGIFLVLIFVACVIIPLVLDPEKSYVVYFLFTAFTYIALAQSWNLIAGYAGQVSLGSHAFFGLGAYVIAISWSHDLIRYLDPIGLIAAGCAASALAVLIGIPLLSKLKGDYFALGTLGLGEILRLATIQGKAFTGGPTGIYLPGSSFVTIMPHYYIALFLAILATCVTLYMTRSRIGLALVAIRDAEPAAEGSGINVLKFKVIAFAVAAFVPGVCGALQAYYLFNVEPQGFYNLNWTLYPVLMCALGGTATLFGPIIGAVFLAALFEVAKYFLPAIHPIFTGLLIIFTILFVPNGLLGLNFRAISKRQDKSGRMQAESR